MDAGFQLLTLFRAEGAGRGADGSEDGPRIVVRLESLFLPAETIPNAVLLQNDRGLLHCFSEPIQLAPGRHVDSLGFGCCCTRKN